MPRAPRVERVCLCCEVTFEGTPAATRCSTCRAEGRAIPFAKRRKYDRKKPEPEGETNTKSRPKAQRPAPKLDSGSGQKTSNTQAKTKKDRATKARPAPDKPRRKYQRKKTKTCAECRSRFVVSPEVPDARLCDPCASALGLDVRALTPAEVFEIEEKNRQEEMRDRLQSQAEWLNRRDKPPKGYIKMSDAVRSLPIGTLWEGICAHDGAAHALTYCGAAAAISSGEKLQLLTAYARLRLEGCSPTAISELCPEALLSVHLGKGQNSLTSTDAASLPEKTNEDREHRTNAVKLGLS